MTLEFNRNTEGRQRTHQGRSRLLTASLVSNLGWRRHFLSALLGACVMRCAQWLFCLLFAHTRKGSLDSLVTNTLCLDLSLLGSSIFVPEGYKSPRGFQLAPPVPFTSYKRDCRLWSFSALLMNFSLFCFLFFFSLSSLLFVLSPPVGAKLFPQLAKF